MARDFTGEKAERLKKAAKKDLESGKRRQEDFEYIFLGRTDPRIWQPRSSGSTTDSTPAS